MNPLARLQVDNNRSTADRWQLYAPHRRHVTDALTLLARFGSARLCVLGAGNCNDLDLPTLASVFRSIVLVDLDEDALRTGLARQGLVHSPALHLAAPIDVSCALDSLSSWQAMPTIPEDAFRHLREAPAAEIPARLAGPFDAVASTCLLSQLLMSAVRSPGEKHPQFVSILQAIRFGHLNLMLALTTPGGASLLVSDVVSSDACPELRAARDEHLPDLLNHLARTGNHFHGLNPNLLHRLVWTEPALACQVDDVTPLRPWKWNIGPRVYLVTALLIRRRRIEPTRLRGDGSPPVP